MTLALSTKKITNFQQLIKIFCKVLQLCVILRLIAMLSADTFFKRSDLSIAFEALWGYIPFGIVKILQMIPTKSLARLAKYMAVARRVAKNLVDTQTQSYFAGKDGGKDVMSILSKHQGLFIPNTETEHGLTARANLSEDPKTKLRNNELLSQLTLVFLSQSYAHIFIMVNRTLMFAGHESTASTTTWALYELAKNPEIQGRVREEIKVTRAKATQRGEGELSLADLDSMKYLISVMKVRDITFCLTLASWMCVGDTPISSYCHRLKSWSRPRRCHPTFDSSNHKDGPSHLFDPC